MTPVEHEYDDVALRDVEDADLDLFFEHQREPEAVRMAASTAEEREPFEAYWAEIRADAAVEVRTVVINGAVAGHVMCWTKWGQHQVGYWLGRRYWGRGVATTALGLFVCQITVRPLYAYIARDNGRSMRVLEKCGFQAVEVPPGEPAGFVLVEYILAV